MPSVLCDRQVVSRFKVAALDPGGLGMRLGVVHVCVGAGADWGDFSACNNRSFWWSSTSGALFVGDVLVPESGALCAGGAIDAWHHSRNHPRTGVTWGAGDAVEVRLDLAGGLLSFVRNGALVPMTICGVWGEVAVAVQLSGRGDAVRFVESDQQMARRVAARRSEEREAREQARQAREATRRSALAKLGLV